MEMSLPSTTTTTTTLPSSSSPSWSSLLSSEKDYKQSSSSFVAQFKRLFRQLRLRKRLRRWPKLNCYSLITIFILMFILPFLLIYRLYWFRDFVYLIRPTFDHKVTFKNVITHYHMATADNDTDDQSLCSLHGWISRKQQQQSDHKTSSNIKVIDAFLFSLEFDLLEIRLRELWPVVDIFIAMESDYTFSGRKKPLWLKEKFLERFQWASEKLKIFHCNQLQPLESGENPFVNEIRMRNCMTWTIRSLAKPEDLIIVGDVDEIPRQSTIQLFRKCIGYPEIVHLQMKTFFYSFEFYYSSDDFWQSKIQIYDRIRFYYSHQKGSDYLLADSGWHCTFCFRYLQDFRFKMTSYSHNDRLMKRYYLLESEEIQRRICNGLDIYDMYPEVYTFKEMIQKFGPIPKTNSFVDIPNALVKYSKKFSFLLKGNCIREDYQRESVA